MTTTATATATAADLHAQIWAENAHIHELRSAMYAWHADPVGGPSRLVKDIAREHAASDREITRAFGRVSADLSPTRANTRTSTPTSPPGATRSSRSCARTGPWSSTASARFLSSASKRTV
jgi:hypothetical protein